MILLGDKNCLKNAMERDPQQVIVLSDFQEVQIYFLFIFK